MTAIVPPEVLHAQQKLQDIRRQYGIVPTIGQQQEHAMQDEQGKLQDIRRQQAMLPSMAPGPLPTVEEQKEALTDAEENDLDPAEMRRLFGPIGYAPKYTIQTGLPHRDPGVVDAWSRENGKANLTIQPMLQTTQEPFSHKTRPKAAPFHYLKPLLSKLGFGIR